MRTMAKQKKIYQDLFDISLDVVIRYLDHSFYGSNEKAILAIKRRYTQASLSECTYAFEMMVALHNEVKELVRKNASYFLQAPNLKPDIKKFVTELKGEFVEVKPEIITSAINWIFYWHYLK